MAQDLDAYVARVRGQYIDVDGVFGAQCWDQWSHYATNFLGVPSWPTYTNAGGAGAHAGWACNVHHNAPAAGLGQWFHILGPNATPRAGDVAFWELGSAFFPYSHVATVLSVPRPGMLRCLTQNPGAVQISDLVTRGLIGYLRPKAGIRSGGTVHRTPTQSASQKEKNMSQPPVGFYAGTPAASTPANKRFCVIMYPESGMYTEFSGVGQDYINDQARMHGTRSFGYKTKKQWENEKRQLDQLRKRA